MNQYKFFFQNYLRKHVRVYLKARKLSQERMSEKLHVSPRSYFDQEHGKFGFSAISLISYLILLPDEDAVEFIRGYRKIAEEIDNGELEPDSERASWN